MKRFLSALLCLALIALPLLLRCAPALAEGRLIAVFLPPLFGFGTFAYQYPSFSLYFIQY